MVTTWPSNDGCSLHDESNVAETAVAVRLGGDRTFHPALERALLAVGYQRDDGREMCAATLLLHALHGVEEFGDIVGRPAVLARIACAQNARSPVEGVDHQTRVVGETVVSVTFLDPARLDQRVALKRIGRLRDVVVTPYLGQRHNLEPVAYDLTGLLELMGIVGCKNKSLDSFHQISNVKRHSDIAGVARRQNFL